jgi:hypothetical protein
MQTQSSKLDFSGQNIYVGFDVHLKSWKVTIMTEKLTHKLPLINISPLLFVSVFVIKISPVPFIAFAKLYD